MKALLAMEHGGLVDFFEGYAPGMGEQLSTVFESKIILKNQAKGVINMFSKLAQQGKYSPTEQERIKAMKEEYKKGTEKRVMSPEEHQTFLEGLAQKRVGGTEITREEAKNLFEMKGKADTILETKYNEETQEWASDKDAMEYGLAQYDYVAYSDSLTEEGTIEGLKGAFQEMRETAKTNVTKAVLDGAIKTASGVSDLMVSLVGSVDQSFLGRQGWKTLGTGHPIIWTRALLKSMSNFGGTLAGKDMLRMRMAAFYARPNAIDGIYEKSKLMAPHEEQQPTSLPSKIPVLGRVFNASEVSFKMSGLEMRADLLDTRIAQLKAQGKDTEENIASAAKRVMSMTGRGDLGHFTESPIVRALLWAPRMMVGNVKFLTAHGLGAGLEGPERKEAFKDLLKFGTSMVALGTALATVYGKENVETDPLSSDFGKLTIPDTPKNRTIAVALDFVGFSTNAFGGKIHIDYTGGTGQYITLAARQVMGESKSSTTKITTEFGPGFGETSRLGSLLQFGQNKLAPLTRVFTDALQGQEFGGKPITFGSTIKKMVVPISIQNILDFNDPGIGQVWETSDAKIMVNFRKRVGEEKFKEANKKFIIQYNKEVNKLTSSPAYQKKTDEEKQKEVTRLKSTIKKRIMSSY